MNRFTVTLPAELARYVSDAIAGGAWSSVDELFAYAVGLARTASVLGKPPVPVPAAPEPAPVPAPPPGAVDVRKTPASGSVPVVDLTRQSFDSSSFMSELTRKLHGK